MMPRLAPDDLPSRPELPDLLTFADGRPVQLPDHWPLRRDELLDLLQTYEYGHLPPAGPIRVQPLDPYTPPPRSGSNGEPQPTPYDPPTGSVRQTFRLTVRPEGGIADVSFPLMITRPADQRPRAVVLRGDLCWGPVKQSVIDLLIRRGYGLADFDRTAIVADRADDDATCGLHAALPGREFGAIIAWAWGYLRVADYLRTREDIDPHRLIVTGHSRGGKAALLAGALDSRIALTHPNNSGCGGAGCFRHQGDKSEDLTAILTRFPHWFHPRLGEFIDRIDRLPLDQHYLKAAVAPRALLSTEALGDLWANPEGTLVTHRAVEPIYRQLGVLERLAIRFRPGLHEQNHEDWTALLDFADRVLSH